MGDDYSFGLRSTTPSPIPARGPAFGHEDQGDEHKSAASWSQVYWPVALGICVAALLVAGWKRTGWVLTGGTGVLGIPEVVTLATGRYADTLSEWTWRVLRVVQGAKMDDWKAAHFLAFGLYLAVAGDLVAWTVHLGILPAGTAATMAVWLTWHLFFRWWR